MQRLIGSSAGIFFATVRDHYLTGAPRRSWNFQMHYAVKLMYHLLNSIHADLETTQSIRLRLNSLARRVPVSSHTHIIENVAVGNAFRQLARRVCLQLNMFDDEHKARKFVPGDPLEGELVSYHHPQSKHPNHEHVSHHVQLHHLLPNEKNVVSDVLITPRTILYLHGGAFVVCSPSTHRALTSQLAMYANGTFLFQV